MPAGALVQARNAPSVVTPVWSLRDLVVLAVEVIVDATHPGQVVRLPGFR
jgi:hypothetical protein